jgi:MFS family permease
VLVERFGWRAWLVGSASSYALGSLVCAASSVLGTFLAGRMLMALGCGAFLTAGRVLVNRVPPSPRRFIGVRFFAAGLAWGAVAGPLLASLALAAGDWRLGFRALAATAAAIVLLAFTVGELHTPDLPRRAVLRMRDIASLVLLVLGSFLLLDGVERSAFDFFGDPRDVYAAAALAAPAIALFVFNNSGGSALLLAMRRIAQRRYLVGLAVFGGAYVVIGADNAALPFLMRSALDLPVELIALAEHVSAWNGSFEESVSRLAQALGSSLDAGSAKAMALAPVAQQVQREALLLAALDYFRLVAWLAGACAPAALALAGHRAFRRLSAARPSPLRPHAR